MKTKRTLVGVAATLTVAVATSMGLVMSGGGDAVHAATTHSALTSGVTLPADTASTPSLPPHGELCTLHPELCGGTGTPVGCLVDPTPCNPLATGIAPVGTTNVSVSLIPQMNIDESNMSPALGPDDPDPSDEQPIGSIYETIPLSNNSVSLSATTGAFSIAAAPSIVPDAYIGDDGLVDIRLAATIGDQLRIENRTVRLVRPVGGTADDAFWVDPNKSDGLLVAETDTSGTSTRDNLIPQIDTTALEADGSVTASQGSDAAVEADDASDEPAATGGPALESWATIAGVSPDSYNTSGCIGQELDLHHYVMAQIGSSYAEGNSTGYRTWSGSQTTTLSVAYSASGNAGTFSAGGSSSFSHNKTSTFTIPWDAKKATSGYKVQVSYHKFRWLCAPQEPVHYYIYEYKAVLHTGGNARTFSTSVPQWTSHCVPNSAPAFEREGSGGYAYSMQGGVSFGALGGGVTLDSEKNYKNMLHYTIASPYTNKTPCGSNAAPSIASRVEIRIK